MYELQQTIDKVNELHDLTRSITDPRISQHIRESADLLAAQLKKRRRDLAERQMYFPHKED